MNGDITLEALRRCQRALKQTWSQGHKFQGQGQGQGHASWPRGLHLCSKVISPFIIFIFAVFDVSFRRYKL